MVQLSTSRNDDNAWEDITENEMESVGQGLDTLGSPPASPTGSHLTTTSRKRKPGRAVFVATSPRKLRKPVKPPRVVIDKEELVDGLATGVAFTFRYLLDVLGHSIHLLRRPLSIIVFLWLFALILGRVSSTLRSALMPLCILPGISGSSFCSPSNPALGGKGRQPSPRWADYPTLVETQSKTFEQLLDESIGSSGLSLEIKKAEMATTDLVTLVRVSNLQSRQLLADSLVAFVDEARRTGRGLTKLSSKVGGAVDGILAINDYALHTIEDAYANAPSPYSLRRLMPWSTIPDTNSIVLETFTEAMDALSAQMKRLILEAEVSYVNLINLEERLSTLHELLTREDSSLNLKKAELLSELWTILGGNKRTLRGYDDHLVLLKSLGTYREQALVHVAAALHILQGMSEDMEDLRERVAAPELVGSRIPLHIHIKSIQSGLERLKEGRIKAKEKEEEAVRRILGAGSE